MRFRCITGSFLAFTILAATPSCGDDASSNNCATAYDLLRECWASLDCSQINDATAVEVCTSTRNGDSYLEHTELCDLHKFNVPQGALNYELDQLCGCYPTSSEDVVACVKENADDPCQCADVEQFFHAQ